MIGPEIGPLLVGGLATGLIGALGLAIRRSTRRCECARLRDRLVDAARGGELDVTDWRVYSLIDWFDQVATTGRTAIAGRHALDRPGWFAAPGQRGGPGRRDPADSLVRSLATTLGVLGRTGLLDPSWPEPQVDVGSDVRAAAVRYRARHQRRLRYRPQSPPQPPARIDIIGRPKPDDGLLPLTVWSLAEEIFAVAGSGR